MSEDEIEEIISSLYLVMSSGFSPKYLNNSETLFFEIFTFGKSTDKNEFL